MNPKISVVIPVYKVEQYLEQCLDSISSQTYRDFELILVDDGSPDSCGNMCDEYAKKHENTRVIHQTNMGLAEARNQGVKIAQGEYVVFVDSDDYVTSDYLEYLIYLVEKYDVEVAISNTIIFKDGCEPKVPTGIFGDCISTSAEALSKICYGEYPICAWGKIYKRELVEKYPYPKGMLYEDLATTYKIVGDVDNIAYGEKKTLYWRQRAGSITKQEITEKHLFGITATKEMLDYISKFYPDAVPAAEYRCTTKIMDTAYRVVMGRNNSRALFDTVQKEIKPFVKSVLNNKKVSMTVKVRVGCLNAGYVPYVLISKLYSILKR